MYNTDNRPLGAIAEEAYEILLETIDSPDGIPVDEARAQLCEADFAAGDADYALDRLLNRGYLYEVDDRLFITEREDRRG